jgi:pyruvate ferredoxin oxidoreductase beta subunit/2-oxoisovalerate ferredoxin oxidoreductase beta subunit
MSSSELKGLLDQGPELMGPGHLACQGCGATIAMRFALNALGSNTILVVPACCWSVINGPFPYSNLSVPLMHCAFESVGATASGIRAALDRRGKQDTTVLGWAGDGGTFDIGIQALSGAVERNENIIHCCYDNEAYMNTGIQRSSATPEGAWTTTTPEKHPKKGPKKNMIEIFAAHKIPYAATTSIAYPKDMLSKFKKAKEIKGSKFIHVLTPCPPGWRYSSEKTIFLTRLATESKVFPIYEVFGGEKYIINIKPKGIPVKEYIKHQGRFQHLEEEEIEKFQSRVDIEWKRLLKKAEIFQ